MHLQASWTPWSSDQRSDRNYFTWTPVYIQVHIENFYPIGNFTKMMRCADDQKGKSDK